MFNMKYFLSLLVKFGSGPELLFFRYQFFWNNDKQSCKMSILTQSIIEKIAIDL